MHLGDDLRITVALVIDDIEKTVAPGPRLTDSLSLALNAYLPDEMIFSGENDMPVQGAPRADQKRRRLGREKAIGGVGKLEHGTSGRLPAGVVRVNSTALESANPHPFWSVL